MSRKFCYTNLHLRKNNLQKKNQPKVCLLKIFKFIFVYLFLFVFIATEHKSERKSTRKSKKKEKKEDWQAYGEV